MCHVTARAMDSRESPRFSEMLSAEWKMLNEILTCTVEGVHLTDFMMSVTFI